MMSSDGLRSLAEAFHEAAIDSGGWYPALERLAHATGSRCGQLVGIESAGTRGSAVGETFNFVTDVDEHDVERFTAAGGHDPSYNPRARAGMSARVLDDLTEADFFASPEEHRRHPHYREFAEPCDVPHSCLVTLERQEQLTIGLAVLRNRHQGPISDQQRAVFRAIAPYVRAAVRTRLALEDQGASLLDNLFDALSLAAFLCDRRGTIRAVTPAAERLLEDVPDVQLRNGRLSLPDFEETERLAEAVRRAGELSTAGRLMCETLAVHGSSRLRPLVLDVVALPVREHDLSFMPRVLIIMGSSARAQRRSLAALRSAYSLTDAEVDITVRLSAGDSPAAIATQRGVAVGTVRAQIKTLLAKLGVRRQVELVARLGQLWW